MWFVYQLGQAEVDNLYDSAASLFQPNHDVGRFDIPMYQVLLVHRTQPRGDLGDNFQRRANLQSAGTIDEDFKRLAVYELHGIKDFAPAGAKMINGGHIRMADTGGSSRLAQKSPTCRLFLKEPQIQDL